MSCAHSQIQYARIRERTNKYKYAFANATLLACVGMNAPTSSGEYPAADARCGGGGHGVNAQAHSSHGIARRAPCARVSGEKHSRTQLGKSIRAHNWGNAFAHAP